MGFKEKLQLFTSNFKRKLKEVEAVSAKEQRLSGLIDLQEKLNLQERFSKPSGNGLAVAAVGCFFILFGCLMPSGPTPIAPTLEIFKDALPFIGMAFFGIGGAATAVRIKNEIDEDGKKKALQQRIDAGIEAIVSPGKVITLDNYLASQLKKALKTQERKNGPSPKSPTAEYSAKK